ncbi:fimbria/pilus periplasmic chaperone [Morganella morganii]|uniref:fimbria/pilus periplasmic chaperone n=1 Tax=Morganella morganii TaxID=582 RepID=UPI000D1E96A3|nr:fimbria/pilus periplasmic chaperone [Morganella morganii]HAE77076.1 fimbrial protein [Morganella sp. (in: enterobacteria)]QXO41478.1 fimbria/pilus periplasmic chaperone [Morganella morganii]QXO45176.1 fimbria/pilus periplasmic chaperone [Morganella morganii]QXO48681.1 fimbria/pilus periplasmic chaperone [Morganella morganii]QXO52546.1 fimbria/pilus periplasmic chaperone [Morganella morganii]
MKKSHILTVVTFFGIFSGSVNAAIALDRTRAVYEGNSKAISLNISNENNQLPYLAQAWIENSAKEKISGPLLVTPPIQRIEPGAKSMVRISALPEVSTLPQDRETLFYFNLREIPPRSDQPNVLQIALQTKIKLFYRPAGIVLKPGAVWQDKLVLHKVSKGFVIENPTPYYITVADIKPNKENSKTSEFIPVMIAPMSSEEVSSAVYESPVVTYINDYGGRPTLNFYCAQTQCRVEP